MATIYVNINEGFTQTGTADGSSGDPYDWSWLINTGRLSSNDYKLKGSRTAGSLPGGFQGGTTFDWWSEGDKPWRIQAIWGSSTYGNVTPSNGIIYSSGLVYMQTVFTNMFVNADASIRPTSNKTSINCTFIYNTTYSSWGEGNPAGFSGCIIDALASGANGAAGNITFTRIATNKASLAEILSSSAIDGGSNVYDQTFGSVPAFDESDLSAFNLLDNYGVGLTWAVAASTPTQWDTNPTIADNTTGTSVTASGVINQSGYIYSVIVPAASGAPSAEQIAAGQDSASGALGAGFYDSEEVSDSGVYASLSGYGLTSETEYTMYLVGSGYDGGLMSSGWALDFTTPDVTGPAWAAGYPLITPNSITQSYATLDLKLNDAGSCYFVVVPSGSSAPSAAQIKAFTDANDTAIAAGLYGSGVLVANTEKTLNVTALKYSQYYTIYVVGEDDAGNATSPAVVSASFRAAVPRPGAPSNLFMRNVEQRRKLDNALRNM